jgi:hypothetical protein
MIGSTIKLKGRLLAGMEAIEKECSEPFNVSYGKKTKTFANSIIFWF